MGIFDILFGTSRRKDEEDKGKHIYIQDIDEDILELETLDSVIEPMKEPIEEEPIEDEVKEVSETSENEEEKIRNEIYQKLYDSFEIDMIVSKK